tara:strand:+ start:741 stop:974 length:234 start_codon:yes stop_codon:yes gene_type:complete
MTPKEFIDENYFSLIIDCKREINEIYQALKDYAKTEQLTLTDVVKSDSEQLKCGECDCKVKYPDLGMDKLKDCKKEW